jgi:hypothetical protein
VRGRDKALNCCDSFAANAGVEPAGNPDLIELVAKAGVDPAIRVSQPNGSVAGEQVDQLPVLIVEQEVIFRSRDTYLVFDGLPAFRSPPVARAKRLFRWRTANGVLKKTQKCALTSGRTF